VNDGRSGSALVLVLVLVGRSVLHVQLSREDP